MMIASEKLIVAIMIALLPISIRAESLRVVSDINFPPYVYQAPDGKAQGYEVDIWQLFAKKTGIKVDFASTDWSNAQNSLLDGKADVIDLIFHTSDREKLYDFSAPYSAQHVGIYVDSSISGIHDVNDLKGFVIGVERGDACVEQLAKAGISSVKLFDNYTHLINGVTDEDVKMICMDEAPANYYFYKLGKQRQFRKAFDFYEETFSWAVKKGNADKLRLVEQGMRLITPQEKEVLRRKWFGEAIPENPYTRIFSKVMAGLLLLLGAATIWLKSLRSAVRAKTKELEQERAQLRTLVESSPDLIWLKNKDGIYLICNQHAASLLGRPTEEIIGKSDSDLMDQKC